MSQIFVLYGYRTDYKANMEIGKLNKQNVSYVQLNFRDLKYCFLTNSISQHDRFLFNSLDDVSCPQFSVLLSEELIAKYHWV